MSNCDHASSDGIRLDPFEKQFDMPTVSAQAGDRQGWQRRIVGQEDQGLSGLWVLKANAAQVFGIVLRSVEAVQGDALVANDACTAIGGSRVDPTRIHVPFGARNEESPRLMEFVQSLEVEIAAIRNVERARQRRASCRRSRE